jgi:hypothetical protein
MAWTGQSTNPQRCPRCRGPLYVTCDAQEYSCLMCGESVFVGTPLRIVVEKPLVAGTAPRKRGRPRKVLEVA